MASLAALITADQRLTLEIQTWMKALADSVRLETYTDLDKFTRKVSDKEKEKIKDAAQAIGAVNTNEDAKAGESKASPTLVQKAKIEPYRLLIVDLEFIVHQKHRPATWAVEVKKYFTELGLSDTDEPMRIMFVSFASGAGLPEKLCHPAIDDLVMKPLERDIFLQKVELLCAKKGGRPNSFLFKQPTKIEIGIGKEAMIDELSEYGIGLRNPAPLQEGVFATVYCDIFGVPLVSVCCRVYKSEVHPIHEGFYLVRMAFFGISHEQLSGVRKYLKSLSGVARIHPATKSRATLASIENKTRPLRVAIIDMDRDAVADIQSTLAHGFKDAYVKAFASFGRFLAAAQKVGGHSSMAIVDSTPSAPKAVNPAELAPRTLRKFAFSLSPESKTLQELQILDGIEEPLLGYPSWTENRSEWKTRIHKDDEAELTELIDYTKTGGKGRAYLRIIDANETHAYGTVDSSLIKAAKEDEGEDLLRLEFSEIEAALWLRDAPQMQANARSPDEMRFDVVMVNAAMIVDGIDQWIETMTAVLEKAKVVNKNHAMPKIFVMAAANSRIKLADFRHRQVFDYFVKPIDRRELMIDIELLAATQSGQPPFAVKDDASPLAPYVPCELHARLAKDVVMDQIAEYGLSIIHPTPLREGTYLRFFSTLLEQGGDGLLGRCSFSEEVKAEKEVVYRCYFEFFGPSEETLKRIRKWIKEDYVHRKEGSGSS